MKNSFSFHFLLNILFDIFSVTGELWFLLLPFSLQQSPSRWIERKKNLKSLNRNKVDTSIIHICEQQCQLITKFWFVFYGSAHVVIMLTLQWDNNEMEQNKFLPIPSNVKINFLFQSWYTFYYRSFTYQTYNMLPWYWRNRVLYRLVFMMNYKYTWNGGWWMY